MERTEQITALDVVEGDIVYATGGYRCRASDVEMHESADAGHDDVARYTLNSAPTIDRPAVLPGGYEGMRSGGNRWAIVARVIG